MTIDAAVRVGDYIYLDGGEMALGQEPMNNSGIEDPQFNVIPGTCFQPTSLRSDHLSHYSVVVKVSVTVTAALRYSP